MPPYGGEDGKAGIWLGKVGPEAMPGYWGDSIALYSNQVGLRVLVRSIASDMLVQHTNAVVLLATLWGHDKR